ncbi:MAG: helix-turn-helix domain-containing protein [Sphaerochaetaceae bacterium]|nr:helix-turn-helix domain-containing protein [Sphaerochaetaceae bacterium]
MEKKNKQFLTVSDVAELLQVAEKTVRKYVWLRTIPYLKIGGHVRFDQEKIESWIAEREVPTYDSIRFGSSKRGD